MPNIVLIGMSGCGKTTLGKLLSRELGFLFLDTDAMIEQQGYDIRRVFAEQGEPFFRDLEYQACCQAAQHKNCVIAAGGGAVTQLRTMEALSKNALVVYLKRDLEKILQSADRGSRPLFTSEEKIARLFSERQRLYEVYADFTVENNRTLQEGLQALLSVLHTGR